MNAIIQAQEVSRWYGIVMGLNNVSFEIEPGLTGLVGPNGAGKSTLIQIITGQLEPSSGCLTVFGEVPWNYPALLDRIGYCPEGEAVPKDLRPLDWLRGLALLAGSLPLLAGCGGVSASRTVSPLDFLLPGVIRTEPPKTNAPAVLVVQMPIEIASVR